MINQKRKKQKRMVLITIKTCPNCEQSNLCPVSLTSYDGAPLGVYICDTCMNAWDYCDLKDRKVNKRVDINDEYDKDLEINKLKQNMTSVI